jgi:hypothetical protein
MTDTVTGVGPMFLATGSQIFTAQTHNPRTTWEQTAFTTLIVNNRGIAGQRAFCVVGSDVFFISPNGEISTLSMATSEQRKYARVPISREIDNWTNAFDKDLYALSFCEFWNNKIFFSVKPKRIMTKSKDGLQLIDYAFSGLAVLEMDNLSGFGVDSKPAWAGIHTGIDYQEMVVVGTRAFLAGKLSGRNTIVEMTDDTVDVFKGQKRLIRSRVYTQEHTFVAANNQGKISDVWDNKQLVELQISLKNIAGDFKLNAFYKPEQAQEFKQYGEFRHKAITSNDSSDVFKQYDFQDLGLINLGSPVDSVGCNPINSSRYDTSTKFQLRLDIIGEHWEIDGYKVTAKVVESNTKAKDCNVKQLSVVSSVNTDLNLLQDNSFDFETN